MIWEQDFGPGFQLLQDDGWRPWEIRRLTLWQYNSRILHLIERAAAEQEAIKRAGL